MTPVQLDPAAPQAGAGGDEVAHMVCCVDPDVAVCGIDVTGQDWVPEAPLSCVVCLDLVDGDFCPRLGVCVDGA